MDERIKEHLKRLNQYYLQIVDIRQVPYEDFVSNEINRASEMTYRILQENIDDFKKFQEVVIDYLNKRTLKGQRT